tara:strand:+ start:207 stop:608 length:402 start_codon:yes stop_codon:yes gene_type:complete
MANGTIAFDTLSTSGQISGTAKSVDSDYITTGSVKCYVAYTSDTNTAVLNGQSFNLTSLTDNGTGSTTFTINNNMAQSKYPNPHAPGDSNGGFTQYQFDTEMTTTAFKINTSNDSFAVQDTDLHAVCTLGDLA